LKNMRDTFKENLASVRAAEKQAAEAHAKFMKIKEEEFETMKTAFEEKQSALGDNDGELSSQRELLEEAQAELASAEDKLAKLLSMCAQKAKEFESRNMMRASEEAAISKAISILNSDEAFAAFGKTDATKSGATSFIQIQQHSHQSMLRQNVLKLLEGAARKQKSLKLARIVAMLQAENPFDTVLDEIKKMVEVIHQEEEADKEQKKWCEDERDESHKNKEKAERSIEELKETINTLDDAINNPETGLVAMIAETETSLQNNHDDQAESTTTRGQENQLYQADIKNLVTAEELLAKAIDVLKAFYKQSESELQRDIVEDAPTTWEGDSKGQSEQGG